MAKADWEDEWEIYARDRCICVYCGFQGHTLLMWRQLCLDHIIPTSVGGSDEPMNKAVACNYCNLMKRDYDPSLGKLKTPPDDDARRELIEEAKIHIPKAIEQSYGRGPEEEKRDFDRMMVEIGQGTVPAVQGTESS